MGRDTFHQHRLLRVPSSLALNGIPFPFFHYCMFRVDTKQAKILQITEACALGLLWTQISKSESKSKPGGGSKQIDSWSSDVRLWWLQRHFSFGVFKLISHYHCFHHDGDTCTQRSNKTLNGKGQREQGSVASCHPVTAKMSPPCPWSLDSVSQTAHQGECVQKGFRNMSSLLCWAVSQPGERHQTCSHSCACSMVTVPSYALSPATALLAQGNKEQQKPAKGCAGMMALLLRMTPCRAEESVPLSAFV